MSRTARVTSEPRHHIADAAEAREPRALISESLRQYFGDEEALRRGVWSYVDAQRAAGTSPGLVLLELTKLVEDVNIVPVARQKALTRSVITWCVEAYFGCLGGDVVREAEALSDSASRGLK